MIESIICVTQILLSIAVVFIAIQVRCVRDEFSKEILDIYNVITSHVSLTRNIVEKLKKFKNHES